ncbi:MAG: hypothetical protein IIA98_02510, partial [Proteobacteria bacterium]|nr:hypothetical protein [Pseudomonadota bacterium]
MSTITFHRFRREFLLAAVLAVALMVVMYLLNLDRQANNALIIGLIPALPGLAAVAVLM